MNEDITEDVDYELRATDTDELLATAYGPFAEDEIRRYYYFYVADYPVYITRTTTITRRAKVALEDL